jgi:tRNA threonylcarbamoyladenosine biosynthesis protein TsaB
VNVLAFDTSSSLGSAAVGRLPRERDSSLRVLSRGFLTERSRHSSGLLPLVRDLLDEAGIEPRELDAIAVGSGPGSFTGVRVAAATSKGLVRALGISLHPISSLAAGAASVGIRIPAAVDLGPDFQLAGLPDEDLERPRYVLFDARDDRLYAACFRMAGGALETVVPPAAARLGALLEGPIPPGTLFAGDGALRHAEAIREAGFPVLPLPAGLPTAEGLLRVFALDPAASRCGSPGRWEPEYLREWTPSPMAGA